MYFLMMRRKNTCFRKHVSMKLLEVSLSFIHFFLMFSERGVKSLFLCKCGEPWETWRRFHWVILETLSIHCVILETLSIYCVILETLSPHCVMIIETLSTKTWCYSGDLTNSSCDCGDIKYSLFYSGDIN